MSKIPTGSIIERVQALTLELLDIDEALEEHAEAYQDVGDLISSLRAGLGILQEEIRGENLCANYIWGCFNKASDNPNDLRIDCPVCMELGGKAIELLKKERPRYPHDIKKTAKTMVMKAAAAQRRKKRLEEIEQLKRETEELLEDY